MSTFPQACSPCPPFFREATSGGVTAHKRQETRAGQFLIKENQNAACCVLLKVKLTHDLYTLFRFLGGRGPEQSGMTSLTEDHEAIQEPHYRYYTLYVYVSHYAYDIFNIFLKFADVNQ